MFSQYVNSLVEEKQIPGAVLYIAKKRETKFFQAFGSYLTANNTRQAICKDTIFDVASLTKVMATLPALLLLVSRKEIALTSTVQSFLPDFVYKEITIDQLIQHSSGLPADLPYEDRLNPRDVIADILDTNLSYKPGTQTVYSDLGIILIGKVIEKVTNHSLDIFSKEKLFKPWGMHETMYLLPEGKKRLAASTEWYKDHYIQGEVHDEKAFQMDGVSASAGLFSIAGDIATFANHWLYPEGQNVIPPDFLKDAIKHRQGNRGLGFEVRSGSGEPLSCGEKWSMGSFGHTGFTGTSLWVDPKQELVVVFLTNAVHYGRNTKIREIRKNLHSLIYSSLIES